MNDYNVNVIISGPNNEHPATYKTFILRGNTSFADQVTEPNTKYVIKWDFNLNGETVTVPENCILEFDGGTLKNGTIIGQDTFYSDEGGLGDDVIFGNGIIKEGTWRKNEGGGNPDKPYDPTTHSGLGRKTLELKEGGSNVLTQEDFSDANTIYVVRYDFDLNEQIISIPSGSVLEFDGGSIKGGTISLSNNCSIIGNRATLVVPEHHNIIRAFDCENIYIENIRIDCTHNLHTRGTNAQGQGGGVYVRNCSNVTIKDCDFFGKEDGSGGFIGLEIFKSEDILVENNSFLYFYQPGFWLPGQSPTFDDSKTAWATYFDSVKNAVIRNNILVRTYSGIKLTGWIENVQIINNYSQDSITDGCDFAGLSALNIDISHNTFVNNGDNGIEFKLLEVGSDYTDSENKHGYPITTPRYFKRITISNNNFIGHRGIKVFNRYTQEQIPAIIASDHPDYVQYVLDEDNIGDLVISNNSLQDRKDYHTYEPDDQHINPNSRYGIQICFALQNSDSAIISNNDVFSDFGLYVVSSTNLSFINNLVHAANYLIYLRKDSDRINSDRNNFKNNVGTTNNGPCINITENQGYNNYFQDNKIDRIYINSGPNVSQNVPIYNYCVNNRFGKNWISNDRKYTNESGIPYNIKDKGNTFYRENGLVEGFVYSNTDTNKNNILKSIGTPVILLYRITSIPTQTGTITFRWIVDTVERESGENPSVTININKAPTSMVDFINIVVRQISMNKWYAEGYISGSDYYIRFISKKNYTYSTPPKITEGNYTTDTDASFVFTYSNGINEEWTDENGFTLANNKGVSSDRPRSNTIIGGELNSTTDIGFVYFDTDLKQPLYWTGANFVDSNGSAVTEPVVVNIEHALAFYATNDNPYDIRISMESSDYSLPEHVIVKMGDITLVEGTDYAYARYTDTNRGYINITEYLAGGVTGDILITAAV